jgi:hypothetical protein
MFYIEKTPYEYTQSWIERLIEDGFLKTNKIWNGCTYQYQNEDGKFVAANKYTAIRRATELFLEQNKPCRCGGFLELLNKEELERNHLSENQVVTGHWFFGCDECKHIENENGLTF